MSDIDRQRISAVKLLQNLGYAFQGGEWCGPAGGAPFTAEADAMHALLVERADALEGCTQSSPEESELFALTETIEAYEAARWPSGREPRGKG